MHIYRYFAGLPFWQLFTILALAIRELSLFFVVAVLLAAIIQQRYKEALIWGGTLMIYACFLGIHAFQVHTLTQPGDPVKSWLGFSGWRFVLETARFCPFLAIVPRWIAAILFPLVLLGISLWSNAGLIRLPLVVGAYILGFLIIGNPDNAYWGAIYAPLLPPGLLYAPLSVQKRVLAMTAERSG